MLWICNSCGTPRAVGLYHCPHCGRVRHTDEGEAMPKITRTQGPTVLGDELTPEARAMRERAGANNEASEDSERARLDSDEAGRGENERQDREAKREASEELADLVHERDEIAERDRVGDSADEDNSDESGEGEDVSPGSSSQTSSAKPASSPKKSAAKSQPRARTTENPSDAGQTGRSSASSTGGASTGKDK